MSKMSEFYPWEYRYLSWIEKDHWVAITQADIKAHFHHYEARDPYKLIRVTSTQILMTYQSKGTAKPVLIMYRKRR